MNENAHVKQHFVPKCYLKGFSLNGKNLNVYDKEISKSYGQSFDKICYEENLYRIEEKFISTDGNNSLDPNFYEVDFFAKGVEADFDLLLTEVINNAKTWSLHHEAVPFLTKKQKELFAGYIAIQHLRLPKFRKMQYDAFKKGNEKRLEIIKAFVGSQMPGNESELDAIQIQHDEDYSSVVHSWIYASRQLIDLNQDKLLRKKWAFWVDEENRFCTSDNPVVVRPAPGQPFLPGELGLKGSQILFPISGKIMLSMWDDSDFNNDKYLLDQFQAVDPKDLLLNNYFQYLYADKYIISAKKEFNWIDRILKDNDGQHLTMPQPKINVY